jgi:16S rRNA (guanine(966)-N(2))-methyltransferase RsmD
MSVRVIAGVAKGRRLQVPCSEGLRPTGDRARETLFNVLAPHIGGVVFLDGFAGSGAVGIEALSRGATEAVFVERSSRAAVVLAANLELCGLRDDAEIIRAPWAAALRRLADDGRQFGIAFFDPPYDWPEAHTCLEGLAEHGLVAPEGIAIIEHRAATPPRAAEGWQLRRTVDVSDTSFSFFGILPAP